MKDGEYLVDKITLVKRFQGKGGWTYTEIPEIAQNPKNPFGWVTVCGFIDDYELKQYKLMPMGNGRLFLPLNASVRKIIGKSAGDEVRVRLKIDNSPMNVPEELKECLRLESESTLDKFNSWSFGQQKSYIDWIYQAKTENTKANRILRLIEDLSSD